MISRAKFRVEDFIRQSEAGECGLACLAMISRAFGQQIELGSVRRSFPQSARGITIKYLITVADALGFHSRPLKCEIESLVNLSLPVILHWDLNHYVVLTQISLRRDAHCFWIADPARGLLRLSREELSKHFTGVVLEMQPSDRFRPGDARVRLKLQQLWSRMSGLKRALGRVLALSVIIQAISMVLPFSVQIAVDSVIPSQDFDLSYILLGGALGLWLISTLSNYVRSIMIVRLSNSLALQTSSNLFRHTMYLPMTWFEKRHIGDVVSRFNSLQPISDLMSRGLVSGIVDGVLSLASLAVMAIYSPILCCFSLIGIILYCSVKIVLYGAMKQSNTGLLSAQAMEMSSFLESVRGIGAIKVFCKEGNRQRVWQNRKSDYLSANGSVGRINSLFDTAGTAVVSLETILFIFIASRLAIAGEISVGMIIAYQYFKQNFYSSTVRLIDQALNFKMLDVHLDRLADIVYTKPEDEVINTGLNVAGKGSSLFLRQVSFRYGSGDPFIIESLDLLIEEGCSTAIVGPSGVGKTTLLKIMCGLMEPTSGEILVDNMCMKSYGMRKYRTGVGAVAQDDTLFAGTMAENISFFDIDYDYDWMVECCRITSIHSDISKLPLRYDSSVGDLGSSFSGGQKQRLFLARALYKRPSILILDEATSNLDVQTEESVIREILALKITTVFVSHRPDTARFAQKVYRLGTGGVTLVLHKALVEVD